MSLQLPIRMVSTVKCLMTVLVTSVFTSVYPRGKYCEVFNDCPSN